MHNPRTALPHGIFFGLFFLSINIPALCWLCGMYPPPVYIPLEHRKPAAMPTGPDAWHNVNGWNAYIADNMPFRSHMLAAYLHLYENRLHSFKRVYVKGVDGHFFAAADAAPEVQMQLGIDAHAEYATVWAHAALLSRQAYWNYHGVHYLATMPPTKASVYSERLPWWTKLSPGASYGDRLRQLCRQSGLDILFLEDALKTKGGEYPTYNRVYDVVHWNGAGAARAADALAQRLNGALPWFPAEVAPSLLLEKNTHSDRIFGDDAAPVLRYAHPEQFEVASGTIVHDPSLPWASSDIVRNSRKSDGSLLMASDSYFKVSVGPKLPGAAGAIPPLAAAVRTFISMHYNHLDFHRMETIRRTYSPDIVVEAVAERAHANMVNNFPPPFYQRLAGLAAYALEPDGIEPEDTGCPVRVHDDELILEATGGAVRLSPKRGVVSGKDGSLSIGVTLDVPQETGAYVVWAKEGKHFDGSRLVHKIIPKGTQYVNFFILTKEAEQPLNVLLVLNSKVGTYRILPCPGEEQSLREEEL